MDAAKENFNRYGFRKTTIDDIAKDAGVGKGTIYLHFNNKEAMFQKAVEREVMRELTFLMGKLANISSPVDKFAALIKEAYNYIERNEFLRRTISGAPELFSGLPRDFFDRIQEQSIALINAVIEEGIEEDIFRQVDPGKVAYILLNIDRAFQYEMYLGRVKYKGDDLIETLTSIMIDGLVKK